MLAVRSFAFVSLATVAFAQRPVEFNRDVRPILSDKCFLCHGPDATAKKIPLRLDREETAKADLGGRRAIVEGQPDASEVMKRITAERPARRMPPVHSALKLTSDEIETIRTWIAQGAKWQPHWSFIPAKRPELPQVKNASWVRNPIDRFILARLEREGLQPSAEASREKLLRRVSLDLTGIPPTPAELDAFLNDKSANAYEKAVDRLLASPRFGERMAARWLDAARYADSNGYQFDGERVMWRWRDWVIDSYNRNKPFNQFALEQLAGDMLPNATRDQVIATGFNRNHRGNTEDGIVPAEYAVEYVVDRVETTSTVFLGLTLGCARCHNHKYDPLSQKEFYQVYAYFNNVPERGRAMKYGNSPPLIPAPTKQQEADLQRLDNEIKAIEKKLAKQEPPRAWLKTLAPGTYWAPQRTLESRFELDSAREGVTPKGNVAYTAGKIGQAASFDGESYLDAGKAGEFDITDAFTLSAWVYSEGTPDGPVVTRMADGPKGKGYGLHLNQGKVHAHVTSVYADDALRLESTEVLSPNRWYHLTMTYDGSKLAEGVRVYIDGRPTQLNVQLDTLYRPFRNAGAVFKEPFRIGGGWGTKRCFKGLIDEVRVYGRVIGDDEIRATALGEPLDKLDGAQSADARNVLRWAYLETREDWRRHQSLLDERDKLVRTFPTVMVMAEATPRKDTHLLLRGAYDKPGDKVEPGVPEVLPALPKGAPNNRLGFAQWVIQPDNPLTARVTVNRYWQSYFGTGLVKTTEDFGVQGEWPSHPELLDWLATEFVRSGWDIKAMQKLIVTSAAYRQSSKASPELVQKDPDNRLIARGPRVRLPAEALRDQALAVSGLLVEKTGGPPVRPYQPDGLWKELTMQDMEYIQSKDDDLYRRGLYTFWKRTVAPPMMVNFDSANREACVVRETRTNTPLQALNLMNDVTFLEAARFLGEKMMKNGGLREGFRSVTARYPTPQEEQVLRDNLNYHLDYFASNAKRIDEYLAQGEKPSDPALDRRQLAAHMAVASMILNLDETITKE